MLIALNRGFRVRAWRKEETREEEREKRDER